VARCELRRAASAVGAASAGVQASDPAAGRRGSDRTQRRAAGEALLEAGLRVVVVTPRQVKGLRSCYSGSGAKSDAGDAYLRADVLRTDGHRLRR
jgi:hypothetical protein